MVRKKVVGISLIVLLVAVLAGGSFIAYTKYNLFSSSSSESKIKETFGQECVVRETCGDMTFVDCNMVADGLAYYVRGKELEIIGKAGGFFA